MKKTVARKATRRQREDWFKGETILIRAILHVRQGYAFYPGDFPLGAEGDPHTYLSGALYAIRKERRQAA